MTLLDDKQRLSELSELRTKEGTVKKEKEEAIPMEPVEEVRDTNEAKVNFIQQKRISMSEYLARHELGALPREHYETEKAYKEVKEKGIALPGNRKTRYLINPIREELSNANEVELRRLLSQSSSIEGIKLTMMKKGSDNISITVKKNATDDEIKRTSRWIALGISKGWTLKTYDVNPVRDKSLAPGR
ncbi:MAG: hypothetical protein DDT19_01035 [Syntrophomonadaceae bacterium]|nr:hypothetical protein [Bacillota bacterium]